MGVFPKQKDPGQTLLWRYEIPEGFYALLEDPQGNVIGIWEWNQ